MKLLWKVGTHSLHNFDENLHSLAVAEVTPEEAAKRQLRAKMKEEYLAALSHEGERVNFRSSRISMRFV